MTEQKIKDAIKQGERLKYLEEEFNNKLYGSVPNGDVKLYQMIEFAKEYDWLLEDIIKASKDLT